MSSSSEVGVCEYCGHTGNKDSFYSNSKRFCTATCSHSYSAKHRFGKIPVHAPKHAPSESKSKPSKRFMLPSETERHLCISMGFDWGSYLMNKKAVAASVELFQHSPMSAHWGDIGDGMKIEVLNLDCNLNTKVFWIASVIQVAGYKAKLRYEGFGDDSSCDFWCNLCTLDVHAVGWCATIGKPLVPPQTIQHKYTNWKSFLVKKLTGAKTLPSDFQRRIIESIKSQFQCSMRLEVIDKTKISRMRVGIVNEVLGGRLRLRYEDSDYENDDFWCHERSLLIHPLGWCERVGHKILVTSKDYKTKKGFKNARQELFNQTKSVKFCGFKVGMKLEAIDPLNLSAICVATVKKVLKNGYLMIGIDGSEAADGSDWFCYHCTAPSIFPVGFCMQNKITLSAPKKYLDKFSWEDYLDETDSEPASVDLFENVLPDHGFRAGMKLEAVDLMEPRLICVATVTKVVGRLLHVHFDGWENQYDQWVDCRSPDIYPVGWCELVGYELQPPPNMVQAINEQNSAKKKKMRGQSFMTKKKRKKSSIMQKKNSQDFQQPNDPAQNVAQTSDAQETKDNKHDNVDENSETSKSVEPNYLDDSSEIVMEDINDSASSDILESSFQDLSKSTSSETSQVTDEPAVNKESVDAKLSSTHDESMNVDLESKPVIPGSQEAMEITDQNPDTPIKKSPISNKNADATISQHCDATTDQNNLVSNPGTVLKVPADDRNKDSISVQRFDSLAESKQSLNLSTNNDIKS